MHSSRGFKKEKMKQTYKGSGNQYDETYVSIMSKPLKDISNEIKAIIFNKIYDLDRSLQTTQGQEDEISNFSTQFILKLEEYFDFNNTIATIKNDQENVTLHRMKRDLENVSYDKRNYAYFNHNDNEIFIHIKRLFDFLNMFEENDSILKSIKKIGRM